MLTARDEYSFYSQGDAMNIIQIILTRSIMSRNLKIVKGSTLHIHRQSVLTLDSVEVGKLKQLKAEQMEVMLNRDRNIVN